MTGLTHCSQILISLLIYSSFMGSLVSDFSAQMCRKSFKCTQNREKLFLNQNLAYPRTSTKNTELFNAWEYLTTMTMVSDYSSVQLLTFFMTLNDNFTLNRKTFNSLLFCIWATTLTELGAGWRVKRSHGCEQWLQSRCIHAEEGNAQREACLKFVYSLHSPPS